MKPELETVKIAANCFNYKLAKRLEGYNRPVEQVNIKKLTKSLKKYGFVGLAIIIQTDAFGKKDELYIADSQHRIEICKILKIPYNYQIVRLSNDTPLEITKFIASLNSNGTTWSTMRYLNSFAKNGIKEYEIMKEALKTTKLTITDLLNIYLFGCGKKELDMFKDGTMKFPDIKKSLELQGAILELRSVLPDKSFVRRSMFKIFRETIIGIKTMVKLIKASVKFVDSKGMELPENEKKMYAFLKEVSEVEKA